MSKKGSLVIISGFSGAGKGTVVKELMKNYECYALSISATTRNPRPGEENGREYFFIDSANLQLGIISPVFFLVYTFVSSL